jgi:hypothetical protein
MSNNITHRPHGNHNGTSGSKKQRRLTAHKNNNLNNNNNTVNNINSTQRSVTSSLSLSPQTDDRIISMFLSLEAHRNTAHSARSNQSLMSQRHLDALDTSIERLMIDTLSNVILKHDTADDNSIRLSFNDIQILIGFLDIAALHLTAPEWLQYYVKPIEHFFMYLVSRLDKKQLLQLKSSADPLIEKNKATVMSDLSNLPSAYIHESPLNLQHSLAALTIQALYNNFALTVARYASIDAFTSVLDSVYKSHKVVPSTTSLNFMIHRSSTPEDAMRVLTLMLRRYDMLPDTASYNTLLNKCNSNGSHHIHIAVELSRDIIQLGAGR